MESGCQNDLYVEDIDQLDGLDALKDLVTKRNKKFTVSVEGNIGCGKTTLLSYFEPFSTVEAIKEPINKWTNVHGHNALELLYKDPKRWSFSFNNYALLTRLQMHEHVPATPVKMLERSIYSTRYVFVENSYQSGSLAGLEHAVLDEMFCHILKTRKVEVDLIVYLRASPEVCYERLRRRNRKEENTVPYDFIKRLHDLHEDWLIKELHPVPGKLLVLDASMELPQMKKQYEERSSEILCGQT